LNSHIVLALHLAVGDGKITPLRLLVIKRFVHRRTAHPAERVIRSSCSAEYQANKDSAGMPNSL
jgi:hypothetical protein